MICQRTAITPLTLCLTPGVHFNLPHPLSGTAYTLTLNEWARLQDV